MKKIVTTLLILLMSFSLIACSNKDEVQNPVKQYESIEEINAEAKVTLVKPAVMGVEEEEFYIIDNKTAVYSFKVNGREYYMRGCRDTSVDMSGIFVEGKTAFQDDVSKKECYKEAQGYKVVRFILGNNQYVFGVKDENGEVNTEDFLNQYQEVANQIKTKATSDFIKSYVGEYVDSTSQRATATAELADVNVLKIRILWSSSAQETDEWIAEGDMIENRLNYQEITHNRIKYSEDGSESVTTLDDYSKGYFELKDNKIYWTGSGFEQTSSCVFEKIN